MAVSPAGGREPEDPGEVIAARDVAVIAVQLGRPPRGLLAVAHRCPCGLPDVAQTAPRLPDGSPFPTLYYLTCPRAAAAVSKLEAAGMMREMTVRLADDALRQRYEAAHRDYLARREVAARTAGVEPLPSGTQSAGGMPGRVKCLHALVAHELAAGGVNPFGREVLDAVGQWWQPGPCVPGKASMTRRVAAVDCGTNSLRLLLADVDPDRAELADVVRRVEIVRLGQGVDKTGRLLPEALARTIAVLRDYADIIAGSGARAVRMVATSATRDADNAAEFVRLVKEVLGVAPEVLTGAEEAVLSFTGATAELTAGPDGGPFLVTDIGGGSTEFVLGPGGYGGPGSPPVIGGFRGVVPPSYSVISVNVGCVRMTERHLHGDPPAAQEVAAAIADIDAALDTVAAAVPVQQGRTLIGLAGSVTTVAAIALGLPGYDAARIHHARVSAADVHAVTRGLLAQTRTARAAIGVMHPGRVDVIGGGALVLDRLMARFGFGEVLVSEHDILDGMAWSLAGDSRG